MAAISYWWLVGRRGTQSPYTPYRTLHTLLFSLSPSKNLDRKPLLSMPALPLKAALGEKLAGVATALLLQPQNQAKLVAGHQSPAPGTFKDDNWGFPKIRDTFFGGLQNKDYV